MNSVAFKLFGMDIRFYSLFILLGVVLGYIMIMREGKRFKINEDSLFNVFFWTLIIGITGARLYYVMFNWEYFGSHISEIWQIWQGGLAIHGGIIFGLITLAIFAKRGNIDLLRLLDIIAVPFMLAQGIGRWGNFFNQEAYGPATTLVHLKDMHIPKFIINGMEINGMYYTPTFFYESLWCLVGFILLVILRRLKYVKKGQIFATYLVWYGVGRFLIESLRTDSLIFAGFKVAQIVSVIMIIVGIIILIMGFKKGKYEDLYNEDVN